MSCEIIKKCNVYKGSQNTCGLCTAEKLEIRCDVAKRMSQRPPCEISDEAPAMAAQTVQALRGALKP